MKASKTNKSPDRRPCIARYWASGKLAFRKVRNMVRSGMDPTKALDQWESTRKRKKGDFDRSSLVRKVSRFLP